MAFYPSADTLYDILRATFRRIEKDSPDHLDGLKSLMASWLVIRLKCTGPAAEITINGRERPFQASYGPSPLRADLTVDLAADNLHLILMDELSIKKAVADGKIRLRGPVWKLKVLVDLIKAARAYYPAIIRKDPRVRGQDA